MWDFIVQTGFKITTTYFDTMIIYHFFQKFKLLESDKFNHLTIILCKSDRLVNLKNPQ